MPAGQTAAGTRRATPPKPPAEAPAGAAPLPLKLVGGAILLVAVFIVAAILGGGDDGSRRGRRPSRRPSASRRLGYPAFATKNTSRVGGDGPAANAAGVALAVFPSTEQRPAARRGHPGRRIGLGGRDRGIGADGGAGAGADPVLRTRRPAGREPKKRSARSTPGSRHRRRPLFAIGDATPAAATTGRRPARRDRGRDRRLRDARRLATGSHRHRLRRAGAFAMPAAAWAARSGDPVLFAGRDELPAPTAAALRRHPKAPVYVLGPSSAISSAVVRKIAAIDHRVRRVSGEDPVRNAIALARYDDDGFGWNVNDPGHGFVVARSDSPLDAGAAAPLSAAGTWGPLLLTDDADRLPAALHGYLLDVKPGYTTDPTRAFYNHVWVIGDQEAIAVEQQAEIDSLAELAKIGGGGTMSEAEDPACSGARRRGDPEDIRALVGTSTPHFALQVRNRIQRLIGRSRPGHPARVEGERKIAELEELAENSGDPRGTMGIGRH